MAHKRSEWFLGNDLGQNDVVVRIGELELLRVELRHIGGEDVTAARLVGFDRLVRRAERDDLVFHVVGTEKVRKVEFGRSAGLGAH